MAETPSINIQIDQDAENANPPTAAYILARYEPVRKDATDA